MNAGIKIFLLLISMLLPVYARGAEETLDLDTVESKPPESHRGTGFDLSKFSIMGRVDLTSEAFPYKDTETKKDNQLRTYHFLLFLKVKASQKVDFFGEFVGQNFYQINYNPNDLATLSFGKILVPFGDTRYFHHMYGGAPLVLNATGIPSGIMFPNIWAENGFNSQWHLGKTSLDTFWVNTITAANSSADPDFQRVSSSRQAVGARLTFPIGDKVIGILSGYYGEWWASRGLTMAAADLYTQYGLIDIVGLKSLRFSMGRAQAYIAKALQGDFQKTGDYYQVASNLVGPGEIIARYGTYVNDSRQKSQADIRTMSLGYTLPIDVMRFLAEYQWNFEAVNEIDNDILRFMLSLDF